MTSLLRCLFIGSILILAAPVSAQQWTNKPVRVIVPFGAGSTPDVVMRLLADKLQRKLNQPFIVENKPGASGNIGTDVIAKSEPDGSTIGLSIAGPLAINALLFSKLPYDPATDLAPVTLLVEQPSVLAVNADLPAGTINDLIALLKRDAGKYSYGSIGNGSLSHLCMEALAAKTGARFVHVPYGGSPQAMMALIRNDVQIVCLPAVSVVSQVTSGKIRMLAVTSAKRSALLPQLPTLKEAGIDIEADAWNGLVAPAKTPPAVIEAIRHEVTEALSDPAIGFKLTAQYMEAIPSTPAQFRARIQGEIARWSPVIKSGKITIN